MEGECQLRARQISVCSSLTTCLSCLDKSLSCWCSLWMFLPQCSPGACGHHAISRAPDVGFLDHIRALTISLYLTFQIFDPECTFQIAEAPCLVSSVHYTFLWVKVRVSHDCVPTDNGSLRRSGLGFWSKEDASRKQVICRSSPSVKPHGFGEKKF